MKSGFWEILIKEEDHYKTTFSVPIGQMNKMLCLLS